MTEGPVKCVKTNYKVILSGDSNVGKTSITLRYVNKTYSSEYKTTIGSDIFHKEIQADGEVLDMALWDTAGSEKYQSVFKNYYRGSDVVFLVFDLTNQSSLQSLPKWYNEYKSVDSVDDKDVLVVVVGNKCDLQDQRQVQEEGREWAEQNGFTYAETSASNDIGISDLFSSVLRLKKQMSFEYPIPPPLPVVEITTLPNAKKCC
ncbi:rab7, putative [Entamoeba invadens IP1]|uniref:Rab7, putative n=1 Tax=Entamoeba invadens IP1 TaxID=370355 RepID=A0A0A1U7Z2_ENTIV|nr:rab7, putative [Entamoeba invadens IP1]ELP89185.1 rab7, putative [Entamoeba invadens IP1]|eukprot:XP_004255956.1 rab7, putative [Entamoeba invadens IP1]